MNLSRYSKNSEEDRLFYALTPHYEALQQTVASTLLEYFPSGEAQVLELGCGTGITTQHILVANPKLFLWAIDNEKEMIEQAHERLAKYEKEGRLKIELADMYECLKTQPNESFDAIVSALALHNCDAKYRKKTYKEIMRVLKQGGIFVNADKYASDDEAEHKQSLNWQLAQFDYFKKNGRPDLKRKWAEHYLQDEAPNLLLRENDYVRDLTAVGFNNIQKIFREQMEAIYIVKK